MRFYCWNFEFVFLSLYVCMDQKNYSYLHEIDQDIMFGLVCVYGLSM